MYSEPQQTSDDPCEEQSGDTLGDLGKTWSPSRQSQPYSGSSNLAQMGRFARRGLNAVGFRVKVETAMKGRTAKKIGQL